MPHQPEHLSWPHVPLASTPCHAALWVNVFFCFFVAPNVLLYHYNDVCQKKIQKRTRIPFFLTKNNQKHFWLHRTMNWEWSNFVKNICSLTKRCVLWQNLQQMKIGKETFILWICVAIGSNRILSSKLATLPSIAGATLELNFPSSSDWY